MDGFNERRRARDAGDQLLRRAQRHRGAAAGRSPTAARSSWSPAAWASCTPIRPAIRERFSDPHLTRDQLVALVDEFIAAVAAGDHEKKGWPSSAYRVSKAALNALARVLARDLAFREIRVNAVCPGWVRTRMGGASASRAGGEGGGLGHVGGDAHRRDDRRLLPRRQAGPVVRLSPTRKSRAQRFRRRPARTCNWRSGRSPLQSAPSTIAPTKRNAARIITTWNGRARLMVCTPVPIARQ